VSFAAITLYVASQRVFIVDYFITDSARKLLVTHLYWISSCWKPTNCGPLVCGLGVGLTISHRKCQPVTKYHTGPRNYLAGNFLNS